MIFAAVGGGMIIACGAFAVMYHMFRFFSLDAVARNSA